ncbi:MAG: ParB/RepB/Spo0J family partition protein [bacterium]|nr:ParB/RepB/Spo0J family partition protein [bacterium]
MPRKLNTNENKIELINVGKIIANPHQPRGEFSKEQLEDLANSIQAHGIVQPLILAKKVNNYQLIAGERRLRAAKIAGLKIVPAILRSLNEQQQLEVALVENVQRSDLTPLELGSAYQKLNDQFSLTYKQIAKKVGKAETTVINFTRLLNLPAEAKRALQLGKISTAHAKAVMSSNNPQKQLSILNEILKKNLSAHQAEELARRLKSDSISVKKAGHIQKENQTLEKNIAKKLGTKVTIRKTSKGGRIIVEFYGDQELDRIYRQIISN